jgi:hypothetical protein
MTHYGPRFCRILLDSWAGDGWFIVSNNYRVLPGRRHVLRPNEEIDWPLPDGEVMIYSPLCAMLVRPRDDN